MTQAKVNGVNIAEKLMAVRLNCSYSFGRITDKQITRETNNSKGTHSLLVRKELLPGAAGTQLKALQSTLASFYQYHKKVTMSSVNEGERLLPVAFYLDYQQEYGTYQVLVKDKFDDFYNTYPQAVALAQPLLAGAYKASDYPAQSELARFLQFHVRTLPLPDAGTLLDAVGESVQADVDSFLQEAMDIAFADVNERIRERLTNMNEVLSNPKGRVHDSLLEGLKELVSFIPEFNITADASLAMLADEIKTKLLIYDTEAIKDKAVRLDVAAQAAEILRRMGP